MKNFGKIAAEPNLMIMNHGEDGGVGVIYRLGKPFASVIWSNGMGYVHQDGDVVYCDPPYEGTASYSGGFDHKAFYDWAASRDYPVYFSSYQNISDKRFKMIWAAGKVNLLTGASGHKKNYECIYTNK